jgi:cleavage and polyadenylation specificity factor subunit 4
MATSVGASGPGAAIVANPQQWGPNLEFDFEGFVSKMLPELENVDTESLSNPFGAFRGDPKHRTVVCRHWLLGLCQNGATCSFLHRLERSKMPACKHGTMCKIKNCHMKHVDDQEVVECIFYKQGFCYNGPNCVRRHVKRLPDEIPKEASFDQCIVVSSSGTQSGVNNSAQPLKKKRAGPNENYKVSLCDHWLLRGTCHFNEGCIFAHGEEELLEGFQGEQLNDSDVYDPTRFRLDAQLVLPFSKQARIAYYLFQAPDLRSLLVSKRRQVWAVSTKMVAEINASLRAYDHVVAYMLVRSLKGIYGVCRISGPIPGGPGVAPANGNMSLSPEFPVLWLRTMRVSLRTIAQLKIGTTGIFVGRTTTDAKFESKVGSEIMYISYRKPEWDWGADGQYQLAEEALVRLRVAQGEPPTGPPVPSPEALFPFDWPDRMHFTFDKPGGGGGGGGGGFGGAQSSLVPSAPAPQADFYTLEFPGFIFNASGEVANEIFAR